MVRKSAVVLADALRKDAWSSQAVTVTFPERRPFRNHFAKPASVKGRRMGLQTVFRSDACHNNVRRKLATVIYVPIPNEDADSCVASS